MVDCGRVKVLFQENDIKRKERCFLSICHERERRLKLQLICDSVSLKGIKTKC